MDKAQATLFGEFPRAVGVTTPDYGDMDLKQFIVHSEDELDGVVEEVEGRRNIYASISVYQPIRGDEGYAGNAVEVDKVGFDFDSSAKAEPDSEPDWAHPLIPEGQSDQWIIDRMRIDSDVRDALLGDVCDDVRELAYRCEEDGIPIFGVFSGFGIHFYQLYEPTRSRPEDKLGSVANKYIAECNLATADERASGLPFRIMRVPNIERIDDERGCGTGLYTIPLTASELREITPEDLLDLSDSPRPGIAQSVADRPELNVIEEHVGPGYDEENVGQEKMRSIPDESNATDFAETLVKDVVKMPCVYERALGRDPPNDVRVKAGIMMLNAGFSPTEITDIIAQLGWADFDRETTKYQLEQLKKSGKGDWSCKTLRAKGLCVRADCPAECPTFGYKGGNQPA